MNLVKLLIVGIMVFGAYHASDAQTAAGENEDTPSEAQSAEQVQVMLANRWREAFRKLDPKNNISITIARDQQMVELENVFRMESYSIFLVVEAKDKNGKYFKSIVYPGSILLMSEKG